VPNTQALPLMWEGWCGGGPPADPARETRTSELRFTRAPGTMMKHLLWARNRLLGIGVPVLQRSYGGASTPTPTLPPSGGGAPLVAPLSPN